MAFNEQELQIIKFGKEAGKTRAEVETALYNFRNGITPSVKKENRVSETIGDIKETGKNIGGQLMEGGEKIVETAKDKNLSFGEKVLQAGSQAFRAGSRAFGEGILGIGKGVLSQESEDVVKKKTEEALKPIAESEVVKNLVTKYQSLDPETKRNIDNILGFGEGLADIYTAGTVGRLGKTAVRGVIEGAETGLKRVKDLIPEGKVFKTFDEFVNTIDTGMKQNIRQDLPPLPKNATPDQIRARAEMETPFVSFKEKLVGLTPDVKKQIQGKPQKMAEYLDVVNARNLDLNNPSALEYGGNKARQTVEKMEELVKDTGSDIGSFRNKISTYKATPDQIKTIENTFINDLNRLNLELKDGVVRQITGKPRKVAGKSDINTLNDLYGQIKIIKQDPNLKNLIEVRDLFSKNIKFGKRIGEVSDELDPISKSVRAKIKETGANIVGKSEAQRLSDYSDFMEALEDIRSYTDRNAGGEYLLRVLLSGRGGEARNIVNTIKKYTGVDLTDDAVMATLVTDLLGNESQKNLFRQEITKAGFDVAKILSGDPKTIMERVAKFAQDKYANTEQVLKEASR